MQIRVPYLKWRQGRPRWEPGPALRKAGFTGRDLKSEAGDWLPLETALAAAHALNDEVAAWRTPGAVPRRAPTPIKPARTVEHLFELWDKSPEFRLLRRSTQIDYLKKAKVFVANFKDAPVAAIGTAALKGFWEEMFDERGHTMANGVIAVASIMLTYACGREWIKHNPAFNFHRAQVKPRQVLWLPAEIAAIVETADRLPDRASVADAFIAALHSGQRQFDVLHLPERIFDEQRIRLSQAKTVARIDAPMTPAFYARVRAIKQRRAGRTVIDPAAPLIICEATGKPYKSDFFRHCFAEVRAAAVKRYAKELPDLASKRFQDLRDTAVTRLALAECTMAETCAITGHSAVTVTSILKHYLVLQPAMADAAIGKLSAWLQREGIAL